VEAKLPTPQPVISEAGACLVIAGGNFEKSGGDLG